MAGDRDSQGRSGNTAQPRLVPTNGGRAPVRLRQLRYFLAAADYGSFRKAAAALSIQESSISRRIRDLEDDLGASLFQRSHGGVRLTVAGKEFMPSARHALRQIDIGVTRVASIGRAEEGVLKVGIFSSLASGFLFDLLGAFGRQHPKVTVHLIDGDPVEHVAAVRSLDLDAAFVTGAEDEQTLGQARVDASGSRIESFEPGMIEYLEPGKDVKFASPSANGGYAEYLRTGQRSLIKLPKSLAPKDVAPYTDAGLTAYRAAKKASRHLLPASTPW